MDIPKRESLSNMVAEQLKKLIERGEIEGTLLGENVLVEKLQVSRKTVRTALQILTTSGHISAPRRGQRRRILTPDKDKTAKKYKVGILTPKPLNTLNVSTKDLLRILRTSVERHGAECEYYDLGSSLKRDYKKETAKIFDSHKVDLWILYDAFEEVLAKAKDLTTPAIVCGARAPITEPFHSMSYVLNPTLSHAIHLLIRHGHRGILYPVTSIVDLPEEVHKTIGQQPACTPVNLSMIEHEGEKESLIEVLEKAFCCPNGSERPTAIITDNSNITTTITWLNKRQLRVPEEVSIINIGGDSILDDIYPDIDHYSTSYKPLAKKLGALAVKLLKNPLLPAKRHWLIAEYVSGSSIK